MPKMFPKWYLRIAYFFIANQVIIKRAVIFIFIFSNMLLWGWNIIAWTNYLTNTKAHNNAIALMRENLVNYGSFKATHTPLEPEILLVSAVPNGYGKYDFLARVKNLNINWVMTKIKYRFIYTGGVTSVRENFLLPGQEKYLFAFLENISGAVGEPHLEIMEISWWRVSQTEANKIIAILNDLTFAEEKFQSVAQNSIISFKAKNNTPYSFWETGYQVVLYDGSRPMAINYLLTTNFKSATEQELQATWFSTLPSPSRIEIISDADLLNPQSYMSTYNDFIRPPGLE